ncbi:uncharacterized protein Dwil_GK15003 [Drosophila willistoni]|uniref:Ras-related protein Rab-21 n=1 Tax=Drosophila willistoni TaxID=7260 RepID=B4MVS7_DROWI|nr:ras-related protein Rab-21-like [Drosophila willistoni]EDW75797.1 uncharacterized protein Dwil_GK15003 [Drosophila willistoni]
MSSRKLKTEPIHNFKAVLLGEGCVGKTSLVLRYMEDKFNSQNLSTLQASFVSKIIIMPDQRQALLNIWDTAGQERFHALGPIYYRGSDGALLVYDITDHNSFLKVKLWVRELKEMLGNDICLIIVGNKIDLDEQRVVDYDVAFEYAQSVGARYLETSAKNNEGVTELFELLTQLILEQQTQAPLTSAKARGVSLPTTETIDLDLNRINGGQEENSSFWSCCKI